MSTARLEARLPADVYAFIKRAAEMEGRTLSDFVVTAAAKAAQISLTEQHIVRLSQADQIAFAQAIEAPPQHNLALQKALSLHSQMVVQE